MTFWQAYCWGFGIALGIWAVVEWSKVFDMLKEAVKRRSK